MKNVEIKKTSRGYEVLMNGKVMRIYLGSQEAKDLYEEIRYSYNELSRQLEIDDATRDWHKKIESSMMPERGMDAVFLMFIIPFFKKLKKKKKK